LSQEPAEQAARRAQGAACHARNGGLEFGHKSVAAAVTEKFELEPFVGGVVVMISRELNERHGSSRRSGKLGASGEGRRQATGDSSGSAKSEQAETGLLSAGLDERTTSADDPTFATLFFLAHLRN